VRGAHPRPAACCCSTAGAVREACVCQACAAKLDA
jgi:hypothetical protein